MPLNLYVWPTVFYDYDSGMAVAIAPNKDAAIELIMTEMGFGYSGNDVDHYANSYELELRDTDPEVIPMNRNATPKAWHVTGGG